MATDATGTPTSPDSIPTYLTSADAPSGKGFNSAMAAIQVALSARIPKTLTTTTGDIIYASAANTPARLGIGSTGNVLTVSGGVPVWGTNSGSVTTIFDVVVGRGNSGDPAAPAATIDSNTILGGSIPQTYKHLQLLLSGRGDTAAGSTTISMRVNGDSGANYENANAYMNGALTYSGNGSGGAASALVLGHLSAASAPAACSSSLNLTIQNYVLSTLWRRWTGTAGGEDATNLWVESLMGAWRNASTAITQLTLFPGAGNFVAGTRVTLYGLN